MRKLLALVSVLMLTTAASQSASRWTARQRLEKSPRHQEWLAVRQGQRLVHSFLVYPEVEEKASAVVVIHENRGLTDWVRGVADQLAEMGYIAIAPDLLSGSGPGGGKTSDFPSGNAARDAIYKLPAQQVTADLNAVMDIVSRLPACNGKVAVAGFCWGGSQTFRFATNRADLAAAFVFYGTGPKDEESISRIQCPVYGFYGGKDARVNATLPETAGLMKASGKVFVPETYAGAGHGFMRSGEGPNAGQANQKARDKAWLRLKVLLQKKLTP